MIRGRDASPFSFWRFMQLDKGQEFEPWVERQIKTLKLRRINSKVFIRARDGSSIGTFLNLSKFRSKLKRLNRRLRFTFGEVVTGIHIMQRIDVPELPGVIRSEKVHICAMPAQRRFLSIPMDEWYTPDCWYCAECPEIPEDVDPKTGARYLAKGWDTAPVGNSKEMQPQRGWGSVVKQLVALDVFTMQAAKKAFPRLRIN